MLPGHSMWLLLLLPALAVGETRPVQVTAERDRVRFAVAGEARLLRLQVSTLEGEPLFDSGPVTNSLLDWSRQSVRDGVYMATLTVRDDSGQISQSAELIVVGQEGEQPETSGETPLPVTDITGAGTTGKLAKWTSSTNIGNSVITESSSKIGILQSAPTAVLHVSGTQPAASSVNGTGATRVVHVFGGKGGNTTTAGHAGGTGASVYLQSGTGGNAVGGSANGSGGNIMLVPGAAGTGGSGGLPGNVLIAPSGGQVTMGTSGPIAAFLLSVAGGSLAGVVATSSSGNGVRANSDSSFGVFGSSTSNIGVFGTSGSNTAVRGQSTSGAGGAFVSTSSIGVFGTSGTSYGLFGQSTSGIGVYGFSGTNYAGYFAGRVRVTGTLTKPAGSFQIDHPLDPANKYLSHSFVESPDMMNVYNGIIALDDNGEASIEMPAWFEALNRDFRYQLTCLGGYAPVYIAQKVQGNRFKIAGGRPGLEVSWQLTGVRQDAYAEAHRIQVEQDKPEKERGYYLHPKEFGMPEDKGLGRVIPEPSQH